MDHKLISELLFAFVMFYSIVLFVRMWIRGMRSAINKSGRIISYKEEKNPLEMNYVLHGIIIFTLLALALIFNYF